MDPNPVPETEPRPLEEFFPQLAEHASVIELVERLYGTDSPTVLQAMKSQSWNPGGLEPLFDAIIELMSDREECVHWVEVEALSSYSETATINVLTFAGLYWVSSLEFGDISYFSSEEDAKRAAENMLGFDDLDIDLDE
jgi:hypothetical protein